MRLQFSTGQTIALVYDVKMYLHPLEDNHEDILGKAMRGLGIGKNEMAKRVGTQRSAIEAILLGGVDHELIEMMAQQLHLDAGKLIQSAGKNWSPSSIELDGLRQFRSAYGDMIVNAYVIWSEISGKAWIFDTGTDAQPILSFIDEEIIFSGK